MQDFPPRVLIDVAMTHPELRAISLCQSRVMNGIQQYLLESLTVPWIRCGIGAGEMPPRLRSDSVQVECAIHHGPLAASGWGFEVHTSMLGTLVVTERGHVWSADLRVER